MSLTNLPLTEEEKTAQSDSELLGKVLEKVDKLAVQVQECQEELHVRRRTGLGFSKNFQSDTGDFQDGSSAQEPRGGFPARGNWREAQNNRALYIPGLEIDQGGAETTETINTEFTIIQDSLRRVRLPNSLKINIGGAKGVKRDDQPTVSVLKKLGQYTETLIKLLSQLSADSVTEEDLKDMFIVLLAQTRYIQDKYTAVSVQGSFGKKVANLYENIERNPNAYRPRNIESVRSAVGLVAAEQQLQQNTQQWYPRSQRNVGFGGQYQNNFNSNNRQFQSRNGPRRFGGPPPGDYYGRFMNDRQVPPVRGGGARPQSQVPPNNHQSDTDS